MGAEIFVPPWDNNGCGRFGKTSRAPVQTKSPVISMGWGFVRSLARGLQLFGCQLRGFRKFMNSVQLFFANQLTALS
jgi:hypothetical protein